MNQMMKNRDGGIKKIIKKRIEVQRTLKKMNKRNKLRTTGTPPSPTDPSLTRDEIRRGVGKTKPTLVTKPTLEIKEPISIIVTAWQTQDFIEECLDSIENQTYFINNNDYEILIGVDACQDTLNKLFEIKHKYRNLEIFMMNSNKGTYVTTNTLLNLIKFENILRFDSDDVMILEMVNEIMYFKDDYNLIRFRYYKKFHDKIIEEKKKIQYAHGVAFFKCMLFDELGGYQPWMCAADTELMKRGESLINEKLIHKPLFYRRYRDDSLTGNQEFGMKSEYRKNCYESFFDKEYNNSNYKINRKTNSYVRC